LICEALLWSTSQAFDVCFPRYPISSMSYPSSATIPSIFQSKWIFNTHNHGISLQWLSSMGLLPKNFFWMRICRLRAWSRVKLTLNRGCLKLLFNLSIKPIFSINGLKVVNPSPILQDFYRIATSKRWNPFISSMSSGGIDANGSIMNTLPNNT